MADRVEHPVLRARLADVSWVLEPKRSQHGLIAITAYLEIVRRIASELRPSVLDQLGLEAAIEYLVQDASRHTGIKVTLTLYDSNEVMLTKRAGGVSSFDLVFHSEYAVRVLITRLGDGLTMALNATAVVGGPAKVAKKR